MSTTIHKMNEFQNFSKKIISIVSVNCFFPNISQNMFESVRLRSILRQVVFDSFKAGWSSFILGSTDHHK